MHLKHMLTSSLLFASVSLAGFPRSEHLTRDQTSSGTVIDSVYMAGASYVREKGTFSAVYGTIIIPQISGPTHYGLSMGVGMDFLNCTNGGRLFAGLNANMTSNGPVYEAWRTTTPSVWDYFDFPVSAGDSIGITVKALNETSGSIVFQKNNAQPVTWEGELDPLCRTSAEWLIASFPYPDLADFDPVTFTDAMAHDQDGQHYMPLNADNIFEMLQDGHEVTSVTLGESSITISEL